MESNNGLPKESDPSEVEVFEVKDPKADKIAKEKQELLNKVLSGNIITTRDRVGYILNNYPEARNSDIDLTWLYWAIFDTEHFNGEYVTKEDLYKLTKVLSLTRIRAKIQNEFQLFQADEEVKKIRGVLEEEKKTEAIEDKPQNLPIYSVFIDETGKNQEFLSVGSIWVTEGGMATFKVSEKLSEWKRSLSIDYEFHFSQVTKHRVEHYKLFFQQFITLNPTIGFKLIVIKNAGFKNPNQALTDLTFHLLNKGIEHENSSGRAPLPRTLQVWLDQEEKGSDALKQENLKERITGQKIEGLFLSNIETVDSKGNYFIQAVDLVTGAVNRKLHSKGENNIKDELADYILTLVNFDISSINQTNTNVDTSTVFNLT